MTNQFWDKNAIKYNNEVKAVNFDINQNELENVYLSKYIMDNKIICDLGCGNGVTIKYLIKKFKNSNFIGFDNSREMINICNKEIKNHKNVKFISADASNLSISKKYNNYFDIVYTKRLLINLKGDNKIYAVKNIHSMLKKNGIYIMIENFREPLDKINKIRREYNLNDIKVNSFNEYLTKSFIKELKQYFIVIKKVDFVSLYYFISRIFNAYLSRKAVKYNSDINKLAVDIILKFGNPLKNYSPQIMYIFQKKNDAKIK